MRVLLVVAVASLASCTFDRSVPESAVVTCTATNECPAGWVCRTRLGRCVLVTGDAPSAPQLLSSRVGPSVLKDGSLLTASLVVDKTLLAPPTVSLFVAGASRPMELATQSGNSYSFTTTVHAASDSEGVATVAADLIGSDGTEVLALKLGTTALDFTPPSVVSASFTAPRTTLDGGLIIRSNEEVAVTLLVSEPLGSGARLDIGSSCDAGLAFVLRASQGTLLDFASTGFGAAGCTYRLAAAGVADVAGNAAPPQALALALSVIDSSPSISNPVLLRPLVDGGVVEASTFSRSRGFDTMLVRARVQHATSVELDLDNEPGIPCVCLNDACDCVTQLSARSVEGLHGLVLVAHGALGETASAALPRPYFDFTPPVLQAHHVTLLPPPNCSLSSVSQLGPTGTLTLDFTLDEVATAVPRATPVPLAFTVPVGLATRFSIVGSAAGQSGPTQLVVDVTDPVGNTDTLQLGDMTVDLVAPSAPGALSSDAGTLLVRRAPWGTRDAGSGMSVEGSSGTTEAGAVVQVIESDAVLASTIATDAGFVVKMPRQDRATVAVRAVDKACNLSATVAVKDVEWTATLNGKVVGQTFENPHVLEAREAFGFLTTQANSVEVAPTPGLTQQGGSTWANRGQSPPFQQGNYAMAFDSTRSRVILVFNTLFERGVWEWDGAAWRDQTPTSGLVPASSPQVAFDSARNKLVAVNQGTTTELWEWDGASSSWALKPPSSPPPPRSNCAIAFDSGRNKVVLFGASLIGNAKELWEWDGATSTWANRTTAAGPSARSQHAMAFDSARNKVVVFGGYSPGFSKELWEWDGETSTWANRTTASGPSARTQLAMAFDSARNKVVLFGGALDSGSATGVFSNETWEWDGATSTWANKTTAAGPSARARHVMAFDSTRNKVVLFGGTITSNPDTYSNEVWEWDGATWTNKTPTTAPSARYAHATAFDAARNKLVLFGGVTPTGSSNQLWEWDGANSNWANRTPSVGPAARTGHATAFDATRQKLVLFGGAGANTEVWEWDGTTWTNKMPTLPGPSGRTGHAMAFDSSRNKVLLFGGYGSGVSNELWEWDGATSTWTNRTPSSGPAGRYNHAMAFDSARNTLVVFGGYTSYLGGSTNEVWEWNAATRSWANKTPQTGGPSAREAHAMAFDSARNKVVLFGGDDAQPVGPSNELWEWDGVSSTWTNKTRAPGPSRRYSHSMAFDSTRNKVFVFGGQVQLGASNNELWEWGGDTAARPGLAAHFNFSLATGDPSATIVSASTTVVTGASSGPTGTSGARLLLSQGDVLVARAANTAGLAAPAELTWQTSSPAVLATLFEGAERRITVGVTPTGFNGAALAAVRLDWVEVTVRYRRP